ncbi:MULTISPECIES: ABC transporter permease [unclassified Butyrivibrio]|uniref:ABC transporter permease n=1 Tax=unclassified Butyrivibrio TaxID=2639466 RepID=UPI0008EC5EE0|nr:MULTISPECIES: ABC transporter permease [unclassified Butyrivibrio]RKM62988.1 ABC transporter permease [Butyrivibrio sp. XB500-5]SFU98974.1 peptide/nickel transport system permease protein [Butyrivibrio sp. INlla21]
MKYIIKKIISMIITLVVVSLCVFLAFSIIPGDPALRMLGTEASPELIAQTRERMGLNDPFFIRYFRWFTAFLHGDMGTSYNYSVPVSGMILGKIPITLTMAVMSFLLTILISIPFGIITAKHEGGILDRVITVFNQIVMAIPPFFSGILISFVFGMVLRFFTPGGFISYKDDFGGFIRYLIFPAVAVALPKIAMTVKMLRGSVIDEAAKDYTRTAYSRGNNTNGVLYRHVLKNALIPVITFLGMVLADMIAGSIVIEQVFSIPGISRILLTSISNRDYPVVEAIIMGIAIVVIVTNLLVDIIYRIIDPRIGIEE